MPMQAPLGTGQSTEQMMAGNAREANYTQEMTPWNEALRDVQKLKAQGFSFGPGAKGRQEFQSFLYSLSPQLAAKYGVDPEKLRLFADASKYLTQATNARAAQGLHGSDMQLGAMISGNPNVDINSMSIEDTVKTAIALRRLQYAQHFMAKKAGPTGYANAASNFPTEHDQRAFYTDLMAQAEHSKLMKSLKKGTPEYERFNRSLKAAHDSGVMPAP
jgi:murein L,D-transpeptidase YcbB/YkuD